MTTYGYMRVSTRDKQSTDRQKKSLLEYGVPEDNIYSDRMTGKTMYREEYQLLKSKLKPGDTLVVHEVSRFSRDYVTGKKELNELQSLGVTVIFRDVAVGIQRQDKDFNVNSLFMSDMFALFALLQSHMERDNISKRTKEALSVKKDQGIKLGRPKGLNYPKGFDSVMSMVERKEINNDDAAKMMGISRSQLFKLKKHKANSI